jgi:hypothetical protein
VNEWSNNELDDGAPAAPTRAQVDRRLRAIYRKADEAYAPFSCPASAECCQLAARQRQPWLWPPEWDAIRSALARQGRALPATRADGGCPLLDDAGKSCTVYADRPFGCRTYFCERAKGGRHPVDDVVALSKQLEALSLSRWPDVSGPRPLLEWYGAAR